MNILQVRQRLHDVCAETGSIRAWSEKQGLAFSYVSAVIRGDAKPGQKLLHKIGMKKAFAEKKTTVMKFEDITN